MRAAQSAMPVVVDLAPSVRSRAAVARDLVALTKPGITRLVLVTTGVGFALAAMHRFTNGAGWPAGAMLATAFWCMVGTALSSAGANALNQAVEWRRDALMRRTCSRPVASRRVSIGGGVAFGLACSVAGVATLFAGVSIAAAAVAAVTIGSYVMVYTPLKPLTPVSTHVGAIPGALPPLIGWAAAWPWSEAAGSWAGLLVAGGWAIVAIMAVWQMPHFMAIAWMHREDYIRGGHRVLAALDETGARTAASSLRWLVVLLPVSLAPVWLEGGLLGWWYGAAAVALWAMFARAGWRFRRTLERADARRLFLASIAYLPLLLLAMVAEALVRVVL